MTVIYIIMFAFSGITLIGSVIWLVDLIRKYRKLMNLQLSLKKQWFEMTKVGVKTEDYREINEYWSRRLLNDPFRVMSHSADKILIDLDACPNGVLKKFTQNTMTLGYPKATDESRIIQFEHKGIEIREGNPDWGAEPGKLYFVIKHGKKL